MKSVDLHHGAATDVGLVRTPDTADHYGGDATVAVIEQTIPLRRFAASRRGDAVLLAETDVEPEELKHYFGGGDGDEMNVLLSWAEGPPGGESHLRLACRAEAAVVADAVGPGVPESVGITRQSVISASMNGRTSPSDGVRIEVVRGTPLPEPTATCSPSGDQTRRSSLSPKSWSAARRSPEPSGATSRTVAEKPPSASNVLAA